MKTFCILLSVGVLALAGCADAQTKSGVPNNGVNNGNNGVNNGGNNGGGLSISTLDYERGCELDGHCAAVAQGTLCSPCGCFNGAVATSVLDQYNADAMAIYDQCPDEVDAVVCDACEQIVGVCPDAGECEAIPQQYYNAEPFRDGCTVNADCMMVLAGPACGDGGCNCSFDAILAASEPDFRAQIDVDCNPGGSDVICDCAAPGDPVCNDGRCELGGF